jgi:hypothetical protein
MPCGGIVVIAPAIRPEVSAPLGWSLSDFSVHSLDDQLARLAEDMKCVKELIA